MLILSKKYPELRIGGLVKFHGGKAEVSSPDVVEQLRGFAHMGVVVPEAAKDLPQDPPADPNKGDGDESKGEPENKDDAKQPEGAGTVLERPAGNASLEAWQAYGIQEGHDVADLKREDIKALFTE